MNNENCQLKTRSEVGFPIKSSRTSTLNSSRLRVEVLNCLLTWMRKIDKYEWYKQYIASKVKCNESNNTRIAIEKREWERECNHKQKKNYFEVWATCSTSPPFTT